MFYNRTIVHDQNFAPHNTVVAAGTDLQAIPSAPRCSPVSHIRQSLPVGNQWAPSTRHEVALPQLYQTRYL